MLPDVRPSLRHSSFFTPFYGILIDGLSAITITPSAIETMVQSGTADWYSPAAVVLH
jgi:hypothetical protein